MFEILAKITKHPKTTVFSNISHLVSLHKTNEFILLNSDTIKKDIIEI